MGVASQNIETITIRVELYTNPSCGSEISVIFAINEYPGASLYTSQHAPKIKSTLIYFKKRIEQRAKHGITNLVQIYWSQVYLTSIIITIIHRGIQ